MSTSMFDAPMDAPLPTWFTAVVRRVDELVVERSSLGWFRGMVRRWCAKHVHEQHEQDRADRAKRAEPADLDTQAVPLPLSPRVHSLEEKYAILSAIHDYVFDQDEAYGDPRDVERIDPWRTARERKDRESRMSGCPYAALTGQVAELGDTDRKAVEKFMRDVEADLGTLGNELCEADTARTPIDDLVEFVHTMPRVLRRIGFDRYIEDQVRSESCWVIFDRDFVKLRDRLIAEYATHPNLKLLNEHIGTTSETFEKLVKVAASIRVGPNDGDEHVRWQRALDECRTANAELNRLRTMTADLPAAPAAANPAPTHCFRLRGNIWEIRFGDESGNFSDMKGLQIIQRLLQRPNPQQASTALELMGSDAQKFQPGVTQPRLDDEAIAEYRRAITDYDNQIEQARKERDKSKVKSLESERRDVIDALTVAAGLAGRSRSLGPAPEATRAKNAVRTSIFRAYQAMETASAAMSKLVGHLRKHIQLEEFTFAYRPETAPEWDF